MEKVSKASEKDAKLWQKALEKEMAKIEKAVKLQNRDSPPLDKTELSHPFDDRQSLSYSGSTALQSACPRA